MLDLVCQCQGVWSLRRQGIITFELLDVISMAVDVCKQFSLSLLEYWLWQNEWEEQLYRRVRLHYSA